MSMSVAYYQLQTRVLQCSEQLNKESKFPQRKQILATDTASLAAMKPHKLVTQQPLCFLSLHYLSLESSLCSA
jgi:hypothetical protein